MIFVVLPVHNCLKIKFKLSLLVDESHFIYYNIVVSILFLCHFDNTPKLLLVADYKKSTLGLPKYKLLNKYVFASLILSDCRIKIN